ncbi:MAG: hypothetical protein BJG00_008625 [Limnothrix sp. CACIAM 69d]|nr:MAG: hypothetical protein BJG00_008625 [Limnothrix sp. CACIAM 69d]
MVIDRVDDRPSHRDHCSEHCLQAVDAGTIAVANCRLFGGWGLSRIGIGRGGCFRSLARGRRFGTIAPNS